MDETNSDPLPLSTGSAATEVLRLLPPSSIRGFGRAYKMLELADRKHEAKSHFAATDETDSRELKELLLTWKRLEVGFLGFLLAFLRLLLLFFFWFRLISARAKKTLNEIDEGLLAAAENMKSVTEIARVKTVDEIDAEKGIAGFQRLLDQLKSDYPGDRAVSAYLTLVHTSAQSLGQRWAEVELEYRKAEAEADRAEAIWRGGFIARAFGFGTFSLIRKLLAVLAIGMTLPWLAQYFQGEAQDFTTIRNIVWGIGWTTLLWAITLGMTLNFNDRRMAGIWKRAKLGLLRAEKTRADELQVAFSQLKNDLKASISLFHVPDASIESTLVADSLSHIDELIAEQLRRMKDCEQKILELTTTISLKDRIRRLLDTSSQGDAPEEALQSVGDIL